MNYIHQLSSLLLCSTLVAACVSIDPHSVRARAGAPEAAMVDQISIAHDPSVPNFLLVVEPLNIPDSRTLIDAHSDKDEVSISIARITDDRAQAELNAQLISGLIGVANFRVVQAKSSRNDIRRSFVDAEPGIVGPLVIRTLITEYNASAEGSSSRIGFPLIAKKSSSQVDGMVAIDVSVTDASTKEILFSFPARGTFSTVDERASQGFVLPVASQRAFAQSVVDQATRAALNDAAQKLFENLKKRYRASK